jgi:cytosine deaminase
VLGLGERYGVEPGRPASFLLLDAADGFDVVRRQVRPRHVVSRGRVVAEGPAVGSTLRWPGREPEIVDFVREKDRT